MVLMKKLLVETNENIKMFYFVDEHVKLTSILNQDIYIYIYITIYIIKIILLNQ